jgi:uncharacterized SAM-binding protein YcdF (DUF218 family)
MPYQVFRSTNLVFGCRQTQLNEAAKRLTATAALAIQHPNAQLVFSEGSGRLRDTVIGRPAIPSVVVNVFVLLGIDPDRITWGDQSSNTAKNAALSFEAAAPTSDETWVLVTSAFHMGQAMASFEATSWEDSLYYPVDYRTGAVAGGIGWDCSSTLEDLNIAIKE